MVASAMKNVLLPRRRSGSDHQKIVLASQSVRAAALSIHSHKRPQPVAGALPFPVLLSLALFGRLPRARFPLPNALALPLLGRLPLSRLALAQAVQLVPMFNQPRVIWATSLHNFTGALRGF
jgi:hypothetical protein